MEAEIAQAKAEVGKQVTEGPRLLEPVAPVNEQTNKMPVTEIALDAHKAQEQELATLREELAAQEALRARERDLKKAAEEEQWKMAENLRRAEDNLRKGHQAYDRLKEEKDKLLQTTGSPVLSPPFLFGTQPQPLAH